MMRGVKPRVKYLHRTLLLAALLALAGCKIELYA